MSIADFTAGTWLGRLSRYPLRVLPPTLTVPILRGPLRGNKWVVGSQRHAFWLGIYEPHMQSLIAREVKAGSVFYDIGANVGFYSLLAAKLVGDGKVLAFEPWSANLAHLRRHLSLNRARNVEVMELAVSDEVGSAFFQPEATGAMGRLLEQGSVRVTTTTLDAMLHDNSAPPPHYIKMDIEGAEAKALLGGQACFRTHKPVLFLATHGRDIREQCFEILRSFNYEWQTVGTGSQERAEIFAQPRD